MDIHNKTDRKLFSDLYQSIEDAAGLVTKVLPNSNTPEQISRLHQIETKLRQTQKRIVERVAEDVVAQMQYDSTGEIQLTLSKAVTLIQEIEKKARQKNMKIVTAVYNASANPIAVHCMDDAYIASYDIAVNKAYTSAALKMSTSTLKELSQPGQELYGIQHTNHGRIVIFGGGEPLYYKNKLVGAIGVSGGSESDDTELARYGKDIIEEVMKW